MLLILLKVCAFCSIQNISSIYTLILGRVEAQKRRLTDEWNRYKSSIYLKRTDTYRIDKHLNIDRRAKKLSSVRCELWLVEQVWFWDLSVRFCSVILWSWWMNCNCRLFGAHTFNCSLMKDKCDLLIVASECFSFLSLWKDADPHSREREALLLISFLLAVYFELICGGSFV